MISEKIQTKAFTIYDASAGSGKTYTLVKEYLKIILLASKNDAYRNILAITFTNKAVHEMKSRVVDSLSEFTKDSPSDKALNLMKDICNETNLSLVTIKEKAKSIIKHLIHNYAAFDISTIDKFTHKVIRTFAHDLNLPITFEVSIDTESLLTEAVDALIAQAGHDEALTKLLIDFTMEKTDDDKSWDISGDIMATGKLALNENNREELKHFDQKSIADFAKIKKQLKQYVEDFELDCSNLAQEALQVIDKNSIDYKSFTQGTFIKQLNYIRNNDAKAVVNKYVNFEDIAINKSAKDRATIEQISTDLLQILGKVYTILEAKNFYEAFLKNITPLSLLNTVSSELSKIQKEQNVLSISEFNKLINDQIQNQPAPFIYERLGEKYRHFFIDEFQDTSEMQWQNLIPLIDNATSSQFDDGTKGTLMIVGDPKQSIYRWRGGKAEQFIALGNTENPFNNKDKSSISLQTNYRSYSEIIGFNNDFFNFLSEEFSNKDYIDLYKNHSHQNLNEKIGGYVNISFLPDIQAGESEEDDLDKNKQYLQATLQKIHDLQSNNFNFSDIVILTRKKAQGAAIANYLTENDVPILSSESLLLAASTDVKCVIYILNFLNNGKNLEAKANFLYYLAVNYQNKIAVHDFILQGINLKDENEFQSWLLDINIDFSFANLRKKSLYEAVEIIISKIILPQNRSAYIQFFLDLVLEHDLKKQSGISDFLNFWDLKSVNLSIPSPEGNNAVRIMTIHKAKGLEFPVVIFPFAEEDYSRGVPEKMWLTADENAIGIARALVNKSKNVMDFGSNANAVFNQHKQEDLLDDVNILYVALTRAEEQLHIISALNISAKDTLPNNMSSFFIKFLKFKNIFDTDVRNYIFGNQERLSPLSESKKSNNVIRNLSNSLNFKNIKIAQRESIMWGTKQQKAIEFGNLIHEILAFIKTKNDINLAVIKALENGLIAQTQKHEVLSTLNQIVNHLHLTDFYSETNKIYNEKTIIRKHETLIKPDRMEINAQNEVFLLDYKTGLHKQEHAKQLNNYQNAIETMGLTVVKKSIVYIGEAIEIVNL